MNKSSIINPNRESHKIYQKKISDQIDGISKWIQSVGGNNEDKALAFIDQYLSHLNNNTKKSMFEHILDITGTRLLDVNKQNDLMILINELCKLKQQVKFL